MMRKPAKQDRALARVIERSGFTLLEVVIAAALFAFLLSMCVQMLRVATDQQRATDRRVLALQTVQNVAEQIEGMPFDTLDANAVDAIKLPAEVTPYLKGSQLSVMLVEESEPVAKRATIELSWRDHRGIKAAPIRLTIWKYPDGTTQ